MKLPPPLPPRGRLPSLPQWPRERTNPGPPPVLEAPREPAKEHARFRIGPLSFDLPTTLVSALAVALVTHFLTPTALPADDSLRSQVADIARDVKELKANVRDQRTALQEEQNFTAHDIPELAQVIEATVPGSAKFAWHEGWKPQSLDWLPEPGPGSNAPKWQPMAALLAPPGPPGS